MVFMAGWSWTRRMAKWLVVREVSLLDNTPTTAESNVYVQTCGYWEPVVFDELATFQDVR